MSSKLSTANRLPSSTNISFVLSSRFFLSAGENREWKNEDVGLSPVVERQSQPSKRVSRKIYAFYVAMDTNCLWQIEIGKLPCRDRGTSLARSKCKLQRGDSLKPDDTLSARILTTTFHRQTLCYSLIDRFVDSNLSNVLLSIYVKSDRHFKSHPSIGHWNHYHEVPSFKLD